VRFEIILSAALFIPQAAWFVVELCKGRRLPPTLNFRGVIRVPSLPRLLFAKIQVM
jgi:hypothetical protein